MRHRGIAASLIAVVLSAAGVARAQETVLYTFLNNVTDAAVPEGGLVMDGAGNLYGTSSLGGGIGDGGTVFELSPPATPGGKWTEQILYSFAEGMGTGKNPAGTLVFDTKGNLYGTAAGSVVFQLTPPATPGNQWTENDVWTFGGQPDGSVPVGGLVFDGNGNLYGVTEDGGVYNSGAVFELSPGANNTWTEQVIFSFNIQDASGARPQAGVILDSNGNLYGTTEEGGGTDGTALGVAYELSPPTTAGGTWTETVLHTFGESLQDGNQPVDSLVFDGKGNLYGTAQAGYDSISPFIAYSGIAFELTPPTTGGGTWTEVILHPFAENATDGGGPESNLVFDGQGNLYGTTIFGGPNTGSVTDTSAGTIFELMPPAESGGAWTERMDYAFGATSSDGYETTAGLLPDGKGNYFGTTEAGGNGVGTVFEFTPWPTAATPTFSPAPGTYNTDQSVEISDTTPNSTIYYTTDGTTPTTSSTKYTEALAVSATETIKAIAVAPMYYQSAVATATYTIQLLPTATPVFSPQSGSYSTTQTVTITDTTPGAVIYYAVNGSPLSTSSPVYKNPLTVKTSENIIAIAQAPGYLLSGEGYGFYTITAATPVISPAGGTYTGPQTVTITDTTPGVSILYSTNGRPPFGGSPKYMGPITVSSNETIEAMASGGGYGSSAVATAAYTILSAAATPVFSVPSGTYPAAQKVAISDATTGATIYYTTNGRPPTTASTKYMDPIDVAATETLEAIAVATGYGNSSVAEAKYVIEKPADTPVFSPAAGKVPKDQSIKITDATPGATIYYTTNGAAPTAKSTKYTKPAIISAAETIKAIAIATGFAPSAAASAAYTLEKAAATPVITPDGGTSSKAVTVKITDTTPKAVIYYTTNDTVPTTASKKYTAAFTVSANETVEAIAIAPGYSESAPATAKFTVK